LGIAAWLESVPEGTDPESHKHKADRVVGEKDYFALGEKWFNCTAGEGNIASEKSRGYFSWYETG
jgi:hypothetical protein